MLDVQKHCLLQQKWTSPEDLFVELSILTTVQQHCAQPMQTLQSVSQNTWIDYLLVISIIRVSRQIGVFQQASLITCIVPHATQH